MAKISKKVFIKICRENAGLAARTAKAISNQFGIEYSRQAAANRMKKYQLELTDIEEENKDKAEDGLYSLMESENEWVKLKSCTEYLKAKAKSRGWVERQETVNMDNNSFLEVLKRASQRRNTN